MSLYSGSDFLSGMQCVTLQLHGFISGMQYIIPKGPMVPHWYIMSLSTVTVGFSLVCNVSPYSEPWFFSGTQGLTQLWQWISLWYVICHSTVAVRFSLLCNVFLYSGSEFLFGLQGVCLQLQWVPL